MLILNKATEKPQYEIAEIFLKYGDAYKRQNPVSAHYRKVMHAISVCRTNYLGGHKERCDTCGYEQPVYNSCRNRHCPKCQGITARKWLVERMKEVLNIPYFHEVFTIPHGFNILVPYNEQIIYNILFKSASETLLSFGRKKFGAQIGITAILHTWGQNLSRHIHLHCIVTGGALSANKKYWISCDKEFLFDVYELSEKFRKCFCRKLRKSFNKLSFNHKAAELINPTIFERLVKEQEEKEWVVYSKKPFAGPKSVLEYMSRYTHRIALSNRRIKNISDNGEITIDYKDYKAEDESGVAPHKELQLSSEEFIRRFLQHILPENFVKIRFYGFMGGRDRKNNIAACKEILKTEVEIIKTEENFIEKEENICPCCGKGQMVKHATIYREKSLLTYLLINKQVLSSAGEYCCNFA